MADDEILSDVDDISADIRAAVEQSSNKALAERVVTAEVEIPDETEQQKADRLRDEATGRYVAKPVEQAKAAPEQITDADPAQAKVEASPAISMPKTWSADAKAEWSNLSPAVQQAVLKREQEMDSGGRQWSEQRQTYEQALAPLADFAQRYQIDPPQALNRLLEWQQALETDPANAIIQLAQASRVDLAALVNGSPQPQAQQQFNPDVIYNGVERLIAQQFQQRDQDQAVNSQIQSFATERDDAGQLKHPHFDNKAVKERMGALLEKGLATDLDDAYQQSIWALSDIRTSLMAPKPEVQQRQQVSKSKAARMPSGAPGGTVAKANGFPPDQSLDDDLREAIAMHRH